jgi:hypothetical protein
MKRILSSSEKLWPYFRRGLLAAAFDLKPEEVEAKGQIIVETYKKRLHNHPRPFTDKTIQELLQIANDNTIKHTRLDFWPDKAVPATLLHDPATAEDIFALETRLKITLPSDLKSFLSISNGFGGADQGIFTGVFPDPNIRSCEGISWSETVEFGSMPVELLHLPPDIKSLFPSNDDNVGIWDTPLPLVDRALVLGSRDVDVIWLIPPKEVKEAVEVYRQIYGVANVEQKKAVNRAVEVFVGSWEELEKLEWCCLSADLGTPGYTWYASFRHYLERSAWSSGKVYRG